ncbi:MAG: hypothetical protein LBJ08_12030, partial [Bifidobacteriaceae bacterium]|nr:hypothetical protein [Bifidobacteriaceae bacterium]
QRFVKPDPRALTEPIAYLRERLADSAQTLALYGDSLSDRESAQGQIEFVGVLSGSTTREQFLAAGQPPSRILTQLSAKAADLFEPVLRTSSCRRE